MGLLDELEEYLQPNGLYSNQKNPKNDSSGNCIGITALGLWLALRRGELRSPRSWMQLNASYESIKNSLALGYSGLLNRSPTKLDDQEGWDDYVLLTAAMARTALNFPICNRILDHGKLNLYCYNNVDPERKTWQSFFGRYPQFIAHLRFSVGSDPGVFFRFYWSLGVFLSSFSSDPTNVVLNSMLIETAGEVGGICGLAACFWKLLNGKKVRAKIAEWLGSVDHPIAKYWEGKWVK